MGTKTCDRRLGRCLVESDLRLTGGSLCDLRIPVSAAASPALGVGDIRERVPRTRSSWRCFATSSRSSGARQRRPRLRRRDRLFMAATSRILPRARWSAFLVSPQTLLRWQRELVRGKGTFRGGSVGGRPVGCKYSITPRSCTRGCGINAPLRLQLPSVLLVDTWDRRSRQAPRVTCKRRLKWRTPTT